MATKAIMNGTAAILPVNHLHFPLGARSTGLVGTAATCSPAATGLATATRFHYNTTIHVSVTGFALNCTN